MLRDEAFKRLGSWGAVFIWIDKLLSLQPNVLLGYGFQMDEGVASLEDMFPRLFLLCLGFSDFVN